MNSFSRKLDKLMELENITNTKLAKAINVDASLISRWRTGKRKVNGNAHYMESIAEYFSSRAKNEYKKIALLQFMNVPFRKKYENEEFLRIEILNWLKTDNVEEYEIVDGFFKKISNFKFQPMEIEGQLENLNYNNEYIYINNEGKRNAVLNFLNEILEKENASTLLLYSDEDIEWMVEDPIFLKKWGLLLTKILIFGNKIKIIHTVNRSIEEMILAIEKWLPLYMTGNIEPYYYPKYREDIFRKTLFVAPNISAITCQSIRGIVGPTLVIREEAALKKFEEIFYGYLKNCRKLMKIFTKKDILNVFNLRNEFYGQEGDIFYKSNSLSFDTMPIDLIEEILSSSAIDEETEKMVLKAQKVQNVNFFKNIENHMHTEFIFLPSIENIRAGEIILSHSNIISDIPIKYSEDQYLRHLKNIIELIKQYENYNFYILNSNWENINLVLKIGVGVIIVKNDSNPVTFAFNHLNMTESMYLYLEIEEKKLHLSEKNRENIIERLENFIYQIEK